MSDQQNAVIRLDVTDEAAGLRLDRFIAARSDALSRQRVKALIETGHVTIGQDICREASRKVRIGQAVSIAVPPTAPPTAAAEPIPLQIVYEDDDLLVVDKPAGLVTHPAPGHPGGTLVNALLAHAGDALSGIGGVKRPGIVHRLDKDTSGLLVVAKTDLAHQGLSEQFAAHGADGRIERTYLALVWGGFDRPRGTIDAPLGRSPTNRRKIAVVDIQAGRRAVTHYHAEACYGRDAEALVSRLRLRLETGRTHQIRVHLASIGHPLLGDKTYGAGYKSRAAKLPDAARAALSALDRQALHARTLAFEHPRTGQTMCFESPLPDDLARLATALGLDD